jgi:hypothetical protein
MPAASGVTVAHSLPRGQYGSPPAAFPPNAATVRLAITIVKIRILSRLLLPYFAGIIDVAEPVLATGVSIPNRTRSIVASICTQEAC